MLRPGKWLLLLMTWHGLFWPLQTHSASDKQVLIITSSFDGPYHLLVDAYKKQLSGHVQVSYSDILLTNTNQNGLAAEIKEKKPELIFALGGDATLLAKKLAAETPIVSTLVLKDDLFASNITGVSLAYPLSTQIQWLKQFFPNQSRVAVLFNSAENTKTIQALIKIAEMSGLELFPIAVESPKQLPDALEQLARNIDILMAIPDEIAMSPKTAKEVLLASFRNRVPLIGLSEQWVKSGALYALSWDYEDLGRQCAEQSQKLLTGQAILHITPEQPRKLTYTINTRIAEHMNIELPNNILKNAKALFQ